MLGAAGLGLVLGGCQRVGSTGAPPPTPAPVVRPAAGSGAVAGGGPTPAPPPAASALPAGVVPAFPGAEGFGALATGGRGGAVCTVTSMASEGAGSLTACLATRGPVTIVFARGGVITGPITITRPDVTIAGHTAPGGVTIAGGLVCDNIYEAGSDCRNLIVRHVRLRAAEGDGLRLGGTRDVIIDHVSIGGARDESIEISRSQRITVQRSLFAEPVGEHWRWGGVLLNYSTAAHPLTDVSLHHNVWNGVAGRLPEISCEENDDAPGSNCAGHRIVADVVANLMFDVSDPIWHNRCVGTNEGNDCTPSARDVTLDLGLLDNLLVRRRDADADAPLVEAAVTSAAGSVVAAAGNRVCRGATCADAVVAGATATPTPRAGVPGIARADVASLPTALAADVGAWPRDAMDLRLLGYLVGAPGSVDRRPVAWRDDAGVDRGDALTSPSTAAAPPDGDGDGMPDAWEQAHGLDPAVAGAAAMGGVAGCGAGYTNLECYLHDLEATRRQP